MHIFKKSINIFLKTCKRCFICKQVQNLEPFILLSVYEKIFDNSCWEFYIVVVAVHMLKGQADTKHCLINHTILVFSCQIIVQYLLITNDSSTRLSVSSRVKNLSAVIFISSGSSVLLLNIQNLMHILEEIQEVQQLDGANHHIYNHNNSARMH